MIYNMKNFLDLQTYNVKARRKQHYIVLSRVLSNKLRTFVN